MKRTLCCLLVCIMLTAMLPVTPVSAASAGPAALTNPDIDPVLHSSGDYVGYCDEEISCSSSLKVRWEDVDADSYNVAVKVLDGSPDPGENEPGTFLYSYTTGYTKTYISLSQSKIESAAGKWVKVFVQSVFGSETYACHYYFQVEELPVGAPAALTNPEIEPELHSSGDYVGYCGEVISNSSSLKVRWEDVDADSYNVAVKVLDGAPAPGENETGTFLYSYTTDYTKTYISLSKSKIQSAAGKWVKVFVQSVFGSETYSCHYYFQVEAEECSLTLDKTSVSLAWEKDSEGSVQITGADSYSYSVAYDIPDSVADSGYDYAWLNVEDTGSGLIFTPGRANYAASARMAVVTVTSGSESTTITVTQAACGEAAPTIALHWGSTVYADGDFINTFTLPQEAMELDITSTNVRKVAAYLYSSSDELLDTCVTTTKISLDISDVPAGQYKIVIYASNSDTDNDYWKQSPFASGSMTIYFGLKEITLAGSKDFESFEDAMEKINLGFSDDWSTVGEINYVQQYFDAGPYKYYSDANADGITRTEGYWTDNAQGTSRCTRAAACMAWSYMGITAFPKYVSPTDHPYAPYALTLGCDTDRRSSISLAEFETWYKRYADDTTGKYSPIVLQTNYAKLDDNGNIQFDKNGNVVLGSHAFTIFGRDINDGYYYIVDPGHNVYLGKIKLEEVNGEICVAEYITAKGVHPKKYNSYSMLMIWQYINNNAPETPSAALELSQTAVNMTWGSDNEASVLVSGVSSYSFNVSYDIPDSILNSEYNYAWLNCEASGNTLTLTPNRANYASEARTAVVVVTSGSESKTITVTQAACGEAAPSIELFSDTAVCTDGSSLGSFQMPAEALKISIDSTNVRKVAAYLIDSNDITLAECTDSAEISFDVSDLSAGSYRIIVYASNSDTANDYWKQSPFTNGSMTLNFELLELHTHSYTATATDPTCTEQGYTTYTCSECGDSYVDAYVDPLGHTPGEAVQENEGDHGSHDLVTYCAACGEELGREHVDGYLPGDINGDGSVNNKDVTRLFQYLSGWDIEVVEATLDVNADGSVNNKDVTRLFQYLSDWDVVLN